MQEYLRIICIKLRAFLKRNVFSNRRFRENDKKLFKYINIDGLEKTLKNCTLKFTKPEDFNDPFEFNDSLVKREISKYHLKEIVKHREPKVSRRRLKGLMKIYKTDKEEFNKEIEMQFKQRKDTTRVTCFSLVNDSLLMWSHYADKHKGVCLEFSHDTLQKKFISDFQVIKVKYTKKIVPSSLSVYRDEAINHWVRTKSRDWEYEQEIRYLLGSDPVEFQKFDIRALKHIYFGCRIQEVDKQRVENLVNKELHYDWIEFSEMVQAKMRFKLEIKKRRCNSMFETNMLKKN